METTVRIPVDFNRDLISLIFSPMNGWLLGVYKGVHCCAEAEFGATAFSGCQVVYFQKPFVSLFYIR